MPVTFRNLVSCVGLALCLIVLSIGSVSAKEYRFPWHYALMADEPLVLEVDLPTGSVTITGYDGDSILVDAVKKIPTLSLDEAQRLVKRMEVEVKHRGRKVTVTAKSGAVAVDRAPLWKRFLGFDEEQAGGSVDLVIVVPKVCDLTVSGGTGNMTVKDLRGNVKISAAGADISLSGIVGRVDVRNAGGNVQGDLIFGPVSIRQPVGQIALHLVEGDIKVRSTTASMIIQQESGGVNLSTRSGDISLRTELDSEHRYTLKTESGNVNLVVPATASGQFSIMTEIGDISTGIPLAIKSKSETSVVGQFGYGGAKITVTSVSGDVTVAQF